MRIPFDGEFPITQRFGEKITNPAGHTGIDYALYTGTPVLAAMDGKISRVVSLVSGYGTHIIIDHGNVLQTVYAHLSRISVSFGDFVREGQIIGRSGSSGNSTCGTSSGQSPARSNSPPFQFVRNSRTPSMPACSAPSAAGKVTRSAPVPVNSACASGESGERSSPRFQAMAAP